MLDPSDDPSNDPSVVELAAGIATGDRSSVEVVEHTIARIEHLDPGLQAVVAPMFDGARARAAEADGAVSSGESLGPLHGVPFGIKDLFDTAGVTTACGSPILADRIPTETATAVQRLVAAGAIPLAKLAMTEFAGSVHHTELTTPRNPYQHDRSPGGSSSGSAVAVAAGMVPFALGTDTVASIRLPAAWNGCVGFKPTWGRVSRAGVYPLAQSFDHVGPLTRGVADAALITGVLAGHDPLDPTSLRRSVPAGWPDVGDVGDVGDIRVGFDEEFVTANVDPGVAGAVREAVGALADRGADVVPITVPLRDESLEPYFHLLLAETAMAHRSHFPERAEEYSSQFRDLLEQARAVTTDSVIRASLFRRAFVDAVHQLFRNVDVLITPVNPITAPPADTGELLWDTGLLAFLQFTYLWNLAGVPAVALPWGLDDDGMPRSVQIIGPTDAEQRVLAVAASLERPLVSPPSP
ncbi:MAG: amidase [Acidimicrobiales bacterium]